MSIFLLIYRQLRSVKAPSHCNSRKPACSRLGCSADSGELANQRVLWMSQPYLSQKDDLGEVATAAVQTDLC